MLKSMKMKTISLFTFLLFFSMSGYSQLMRSEVYDFSVGDYFGIAYRAGSWYGDEQHTKDYMYLILSKQLSTNGDTVVYSAQRQIYLRPIPDGNGGTTPSSLSIDTFEFSYTNLNAPYHLLDYDHTFGNNLSIYWQIDTSNCDTSSITSSSSDFCAGLIDQKMEFEYSNMNFGEGCFDDGKGYSSNYRVYSHAGGPYGGWSHPQPHPVFFYDNYNLFFTRQNGAACGSFPDYFLSMEEQLPLKFSVFPNPANNQLNISEIEGVEYYRVTSADGKKVNQVKLQDYLTLDISNLNSGVYFLHVTDGSGKSGVVRFVK